jgi:hypothetical protein
MFAYEPVFENIKRALSVPNLKNDFFFVLREPNNYTDSEYWRGIMQSKNNYTEPPYAKKPLRDIVLNVFNATSWKLISSFNQDQKSTSFAVDQGRKDCRGYTYNMFSDMRECWEMVRRHERFHNFRYALFTRARPDVIYNFKLPAFPLSLRDVYNGSNLCIAKHDVFLVLSRTLAREILFNLSEEILECGDGAYHPKHSNEQIFTLKLNSIVGEGKCHSLLPSQKVHISRPCKASGRFSTDFKWGKDKAHWQFFCVDQEDYKNLYARFEKEQKSLQRDTQAHFFKIVNLQHALIQNKSDIIEKSI